MMSDLDEQRRARGAGRAPDGAQQGERAGLLEGDDQEEQAGHARHDQAVEQEDDLERLADLGHARRPSAAPPGSARRGSGAAALIAVTSSAGVVPWRRRDRRARWAAASRRRGCGLHGRDVGRRTRRTSWATTLSWASAASPTTVSSRPPGSTTTTSPTSKPSSASASLATASPGCSGSRPAVRKRGDPEALAFVADDRWHRPARRRR